jgi:hypothetical protein
MQDAISVYVIKWTCVDISQMALQLGQALTPILKVKT